MKYLKNLLIIFIATMTLSQASLATGGVFPYKVERVTLKNGFKAILIPISGSGLISYYSVVRTGSRDEWEPGKSGFAHFFEHMMFRGTERFPGNVYDSIVTSMGADANAYTSSDLTVYHLTAANDYLETIIDIESDRFRNLRYTKEQFQTESGAVYGEYRKGRTSPWSVAFEAFQDMAFDKHTYKHTTIGFEKDIIDMPNQYDYSLSFYKRYYRPENVILVISGDFDVDKAKAFIEKYYSPWDPGYVMPEIDPEPVQTAPRSTKVTYDGKTLPLLMIGYKCDAFDVNNPDYLALDPFAEVAFGRTSDIYKKLVLEEQKVTFIQAGTQSSRDPFPFMIYTQVKKIEDMEYVQAEIEKTIERFKTELIDKSMLEILKKRDKYQFLMQLDSPESVASILPQYITLTGDIKVIDEYFANFDKITPEQIVKSINKYFVESGKNLLILTGN